MKTSTAVRGLVYIGLGLTFTIPALFATNFAAKSATQTAEAHQAMRDRYQEAVNELNLTDDQKGKVKDIFDEARTKRQDIMKDNSLTDDQKKEKMKELHSDTRTSVNEILTPDQRNQLKEKMAATATAKQPQ